MPIGKIGKGRRKRHPKYKSPRRRTVGQQSVRMPGDSGFLSLDAKATYVTLEQRLIVTITAKRRADNRGPSIMLKHVEEEWSRKNNADGTLTSLLGRVLKETAEKVQGKVLPERGVYLNSCCRHGDEMSFLQTVCSSCRCWYCDLSES